MKRRNLFAVVALMAMMPVAVLMAKPHVTLLKPPPGRYGIEDLWKAVVISDTACDAWFEGFVFEETHGQVFHATTKPFPLTRGTKVYGYRDVRIDKTETATGYEAFVIRGGQLPAGIYSFKLLLMSFGVGDSFGFEPKPMGPPRLVTPRDGDTVKVKYPQFVWTPPMPVPTGGVTYELKLFEVLPGQDPEEAVRANPPWWSKTGIVATSLTYPTSAPAMDTGAYAWQVTATTADGQTARSEVRVFTPLQGPPPPPPPPWTTDATFVWQHQNTVGPNWEIWYADFTAGAPAASTPQALYTGTGNNMDPAVAYDRNGSTWAVWSHQVSGQYEIFWSRRMAGTTTWSNPVAIAPPPAPEHQVDPAIAFDDNGTGFCIWGQGQLWTLNGGGDGMFLHCAFWDGSSWSAESKLPGVGDTCRLPEITFTSAPATGQTPLKTNHAAVAIAASHWTFPGRVFRWTWDGSAWTDAAALPTTGGVVSHTYAGYLTPIMPMPAQDHVTIATLRAPVGTKHVVTAAWTRQTPAAQAKLMACNGYFDGSTWTWTEFPSWLSNGTAGTTFHDPAIAVDGTDKSHNVFISTGRVWEKRGGNACAMLIPPPGGSNGIRPATAWVRGVKSGVLAVWYDTDDIRWSFRNNTTWTWTAPAAVVVSGLDFNPDAAARTGSHTMPVQ